MSVDVYRVDRMIAYWASNHSAFSYIQTLAQPNVREGSILHQSAAKRDKNLGNTRDRDSLEHRTKVVCKVLR